jgi:hypothetical protein
VEVVVQRLLELQLERVEQVVAVLVVQMLPLKQVLLGQLILVAVVAEVVEHILEQLGQEALEDLA